MSKAPAKTKPDTNAPTDDKAKDAAPAPKPRTSVPVCDLDAKTREKSCSEELEALLTKWDCRLVGVPYTDDQGGGLFALRSAIRVIAKNA